MAIEENEGLAVELRVRTCVELRCNADIYRHLHSDFKFIAGDVEEEARAGAPKGAWSTAWHVVALASVLGLTISSIYPPFNGLVDQAIAILNRKFLP